MTSAVTPSTAGSPARTPRTLAGPVLDGSPHAVDDVRMVEHGALPAAVLPSGPITLLEHCIYAGGVLVWALSEDAGGDLHGTPAPDAELERRRT